VAVDRLAAELTAGRHIATRHGQGGRDRRFIETDQGDNNVFHASEWAFTLARRLRGEFGLPQPCASKQCLQCPSHILERSSGGCWPSHEYHVEARLKAIINRARYLTDAPLDPVSNDGVSDPAADDNPDPGWLGIIPLLPRADQQGMGPTGPIGSHSLEIDAPSEPEFSAHFGFERFTATGDP